MDVEQRFTELRDRWKDETGFLSSMTGIVTNSAYQEIIALGQPAVPLILSDMKSDPQWWFFALRALTGESPDKDAETFDEAHNAWLAWGRQQGHIA